MTPSIIIAGGGTGGHIFPAIAIGQALQRACPGVKLLYVGALGKMEMEKVPLAGFKIVGLDIAGFNRSNLWSNWRLPFRLLRSIVRAQSILKKERPQCVVGVGGYASFPMLRAAQRAGIPTLIQEQNAYAGRSNKVLGKRAKRICVAYDGMGAFFQREKLVKTGNPVRASIAHASVSREDGLKRFGLDPLKQTILVVGGSLGAQAINEGIENSLEQLVLHNGVQIIWQTGKPFHERAVQAATSYGARVVATAFIQDMEYAYAAADVVVSRAGALAIAELCIAGKPVVFVPYPYAAEDHQTSNARRLVDSDAATMLSNAEAPEGLYDVLQELLTDEDRRQRYAENISRLAIRNADDRIAEEILHLLNPATA